MEKSCTICGNNVTKIFDAFILKKYKSDYSQCANCGYIQTDKPYWLSEAYISAITSLDVGLINRNLEFATIIPSLLDVFSDENDSYVDYGGGYGMFVRIMRDKGYSFYLHDVYAENLFAKHFELKDYKQQGKFASLTAFEVFEHLENPIDEVGKMFELSDSIIFSTLLSPSVSFKNASDWWYFAPETGQHLSFYTKRSLSIIAEKFQCKFYTNNVNLHMLTKLDVDMTPYFRNMLKKKPAIATLLDKIKNRMNKTSNPRKSLLPVDFNHYKSYLYEQP